MYKGGSLALKLKNLEETLMKQTIKQHSDEDGNLLSLTSSESDDEEDKPKMQGYQLVQFEEYKLDLNTSKHKEAKRKFSTEYDNIKENEQTQRKIKNMYNKTVLGNKSYQQDDRQSEISKELQECKKELLVKDGQIAMLERIINQYLGQGFSKDKIHQYSNINHNNSQSDEYISRIRQLSQQIRYKNNQLAEYKYQNVKLHGQIENLQNEIYFFKNKQQNNRLTMQSYHRKQLTQNNRSKTNSFWENDIRPSIKINLGINDLQKRLDLLKENRDQIERSKSKGRGKTSRGSINDITKEQKQHWASKTVKLNNKLEIKLPRSKYENTFAEKYQNRSAIIHN